ncbi:hypothetical protein GCM10009676_13560 [Prauserella halophila]|uniref:MFS transporter n=1 Tax=Prauserella halophila TaxID=185641 RepID=A0ABN1W3A0_9PSEU
MPSVKTALLTVAAPARIGLAGVLAEIGSPLLAAVSVTGVWILVLMAVLASRDLESKEILDAQQ